jgi:hypothetical protein
MNLKSAIPVRFGMATLERLKVVSSASGIPVSQLIRMATERYLKDIDKNGSITIPLKSIKRAAPRVAKKPKP